MIIFIRFFFDNLYNFIIESLKVECVRCDDTRAHFFLFSQYIYINRVNKKLRRFFKDLFFNHKVIFEYLLNNVLFRRLFLEFRIEFLRLRIKFESFRRFTLFFNEVNHEIYDLYVIITSNEFISLKAIHYRLIKNYKKS